MRTRNILMMLIVMVTMSGTNVKAQQVFKAKKVLVAYFSWSGNTESVALEIQNQSGADTFRLVPAEPYTDDYDALLDIAQEEQRNGARFWRGDLE